MQKQNIYLPNFSCFCGACSAVGDIFSLRVFVSIFFLIFQVRPFFFRLGHLLSCYLLFKRVKGLLFCFAEMRFFNKIKKILHFSGIWSSIRLWKMHIDFDSIQLTFMVTYHIPWNRNASILVSQCALATNLCLFLPLSLSLCERN